MVKQALNRVGEDGDQVLKFSAMKPRATRENMWPRVDRVVPNKRLTGEFGFGGQEERAQR